MTQLNELKTKQAFDDVMEKSLDGPVFLFKHSTTCPISAKAYEEYNTFLDSSDDDVDAYMVKVIESKEVSNYIAEATGVKHESPQIFLLKNKEVLWHDSHSNITADAIREKVQQVH